MDSHPPRDHQSLTDRFSTLARRTAGLVGSPWAFLLALVVVAIWGASGPVFHYSDTWQLVINTGTTIITFLIVFLIQNTQNRDSKAVHLKLDEVIRAVHGARNQLIDLENMSEEEMKKLADEFTALHERERQLFDKRGQHLGYSKPAPTDSRQAPQESHSQS